MNQLNQMNQIVLNLKKKAFFRFLWVFIGFVVIAFL